MKNADIPQYVAERKEFKLPSSSGVINDDGDYNLYSYVTLIGMWSGHGGGQIYFNEAKYSVTTTRLQNNVRGVQ